MKEKYSDFELTSDDIFLNEIMDYIDEKVQKEGGV